MLLELAKLLGRLPLRITLCARIPVSRPGHCESIVCSGQRRAVLALAVTSRSSIRPQRPGSEHTARGVLAAAQVIMFVVTQANLYLYTRSAFTSQKSSRNHAPVLPRAPYLVAKSRATRARASSPPPRRRCWLPCCHHQALHRRHCASQSHRATEANTQPATRPIAAAAPRVLQARSQSKNIAPYLQTAISTTSAARIQTRVH